MNTFLFFGTEKIKLETGRMQYAPTGIETTHEAGAKAKLVLTMPCKKEFFLRSEKKLKTGNRAYAIRPYGN